MRQSIALCLCALAASLAGCATPRVVVSNGGSQADITSTITTTGGLPGRLTFTTSLNPDCTPSGSRAVVKVVQPAQHGEVEVKETQDFPNFPPFNPRAKCNSQRVPGTIVTYHPARGYVGDDAFAYETYTNTGRVIRNSITANVR